MGYAKMYMNMNGFQIPEGVTIEQGDDPSDHYIKLLNPSAGFEDLAVVIMDEGDRIRCVVEGEMDGAESVRNMHKLFGAAADLAERLV
jgi:hypothetical protein